MEIEGEEEGKGGGGGHARKSTAFREIMEISGTDLGWKFIHQSSVFFFIFILASLFSFSLSFTFFLLPSLFHVFGALYRHGFVYL